METKRHGIMYFTTVVDYVRGDLTFIELPQDIGFDIKRVFYIYGNQEGIVRGQHAHKTCKQVLVALKGTITVKVSDGEYKLHTPNEGLFINTGVYIEIDFNESDSILLVLASEHFSVEDYMKAGYES